MQKLLRSATIVTLLAAAGIVTSASAETVPSAKAKPVTPATRPAGPVATPGKAVVQAVLNKFEKEIAAFEATERKSPSKPGGVMFYGSSSVRLWKTLAEDYAGLSVVNRGFGGSTTPDALLYAERVVLPSRPATIVFYEGDNDLQAGRKPEQVVADYQAFAKLVHSKLPETKILFVSVKPSPRRLELLPIQRQVNQLASNWIAKAKDPRLTFVDVFTPMLDKSGKPRAELFGPDSLHMNRDGYKLWTSVIGLKPTVAAAKAVVGAAVTAGATISGTAMPTEQAGAAK